MRVYFVPNRLFLVVLLLAALIVFPLIAYAQESTEEAPAPTLEATTPAPDPVPDEPPPVDEPSVATPETFFAQLWQLLLDVTYIPWAAAGVVVLVGVVKVIAKMLNITVTGRWAVLLALVFQVLIWLAYSTAVHFNQAENFQTWYLAVINVFQSLLPLFGAIVAGHLGFEYANRKGVPVLGYKPPKKLVASPLKPAERERVVKEAYIGTDWAQEADWTGRNIPPPNPETPNG